MGKKLKLFSVSTDINIYLQLDVLCKYLWVMPYILWIKPYYLGFFFFEVVPGPYGRGWLVATANPDQVSEPGGQTGQHPKTVPSNTAVRFLLALVSRLINIPVLKWGICQK